MRLAVMRPKDKLDTSIAQAREAGFDVIAASPLQVALLEDEIDSFLSDLDSGRVDAIVLTSSTGVDSLVALMGKRGRDDLRGAFARSTLIAIGPLTAKAMESTGLSPVLVPDEHSSEGLVRAFATRLSGKRVYLLRFVNGEAALREGLTAVGCIVREVPLYDLVPHADSPEMSELAKESMAGRVDAFAFTSLLTAATFLEAAENYAPREDVVTMLNSRLVAAMGEPTRRKLEQMGIYVDVTPSSATFEALLLELKKRF